MNVFLVDLTHGGVKISYELAKRKKYENVFAYDLYNTLKKEDENLLKTYNVNIIKDIDSFKEELNKNSKDKSNAKDLNNDDSTKKDLNKNDSTKKDSNKKDLNNSNKDLIINPIHSSLKIDELLNEDEMKFYNIINHHQATELVLRDWKEETEKQNIKTIEITGVKGKTSTAFLLKEIFLENKKNTLLLSSLGAYLFRKEQNNEQKLILQKNISITPANIINTVQLAKKIKNPKCSTFTNHVNKHNLEDKIDKNGNTRNLNDNPYQNLNYDISIFENSLGICGLGDIGIFTNLVENYPIAKGQSNAREAKKQVFKSPLVVIEHETLHESYPKEYEKYNAKINSFSLNDANANVFCKEIKYDIDRTKIKVSYHDLKTIDKKVINGKLEIDSFAPGKHHVLNLLAAATTALSLGIDEAKIQNALGKFKGIDGRTNVREINNLRIIEEINPGINTKAIESSINMINDIEGYFIIIGGKYGVTCEEIDEDKLSLFLYEYIKQNPNSNLILTDEVGKSLENKINLLNLEKNKNKENNDEPIEIRFIEDYEKAQDIAIENNKNILFIYRSNYSQVSKR